MLLECRQLGALIWRIPGKDHAEQEERTSNHKRLLPLACGLVFGAMVAGRANADFLSYAAKFNCGPRNPPADTDVTVGIYRTSINVHNPQEVAVTFTKKFVLAVPEPGIEGAPVQSKIVKMTETLGADAAEFVDCSRISAELGLSGSALIEGFVVFQVQPSGGQQPYLDVVGKYTARGSLGGTTFFPTPALEIVVYPPTLIKETLEFF